jgi:hypothetical protein
VPAACPDLEDIAALLDGKLTARERARLTEHLAGCESCYETFAGTAHILEDSRQEQLLPAAPRHPFERPRAPRARQPRTWWAAAALAAMLAATVGLVVFLQGTRGAGPSTSELASLIGGSETASKVPWTGRIYRGRSELPDLPAESEAFRLGVRLLDLHLALEGDNRGRAEDTLRMLHLLFYGMTLPSPEMAGAYDELGKKMKPGIAPHVLLGEAAALEKKAVEELQEEPRFVELGRWTEACRLAAVSGRPDLFRKRATLRVLDQAVAPGGKDAGTLDPKSTQILRDIRDKITGGRFDVADLGRQCSDLLTQLDSD